MPKLRMLGDYVAVKAITERELDSGIVLPSTVKKDRPQEGKVLSVGPGKMGDDNERIPMSVKEGDHIIFGGWNDPVKVEGEELYFVHEEDIKAIVEK